MINNNNLIAAIMSMFILMICMFTNNNKINKKINNLEKFSTTSSIDELDSKIEQKINSIYNMDIEAIRNLGSIAKSIINSDSEDGTLIIPSNVIIKGHCQIIGKNTKGTGLTLVNKLWISKKDQWGNSIVIGSDGGIIQILGKDSKNRSLVIEDTGGSIQLNGKNENNTALDIQEGKIFISKKDTDGISIAIGSTNGGSIYIGGKNKKGYSIESKGRIRLFGTAGGRAIDIEKDAGFIYVDGKTGSGYGLEIANGIRIKGKSDSGYAVKVDGNGKISGVD